MFNTIQDLFAQSGYPFLYNLVGTSVRISSMGRAIDVFAAHPERSAAAAAVSPPFILTVSSSSTADFRLSDAACVTVSPILALTL